MYFVIMKKYFIKTVIQTLDLRKFEKGQSRWLLTWDCICLRKDVRKVGMCMMQRTSETRILPVPSSAYRVVVRNGHGICWGDKGGWGGCERKGNELCEVLISVTCGAPRYHEAQLIWIMPIDFSSLLKVRGEKNRLAYGILRWGASMLYFCTRTAFIVGWL